MINVSHFAKYGQFKAAKPRVNSSDTFFYSTSCLSKRTLDVSRTTIVWSSLRSWRFFWAVNPVAAWPSPSRSLVQKHHQLRRLCLMKIIVLYKRVWSFNSLSNLISLWKRPKPIRSTVFGEDKSLIPFLPDSLVGALSFEKTISREIVF